MQHLPVYKSRGEILDSLKTHQVVIVESPTGSGKTTQIPLILHESGYTAEKMVGITQPRRIATLSVCDFIKRQIDDTDSFVGYKMRFSDTTTPTTRLKIMTDGILLMELKADPLLNQYSVILVDEAHERSLNIDFVLGLLLNIVKVRKDFKVIVSSATINTSIFSKFFNDAPIISINARIHPVDIHYSPLYNPRDRYEIFGAIEDIVVKSVQNSPGDILIFLPGEADIKMCMNQLSTSSVKKDLVIYPLYGRLSKEEQERVFIKTPKGKTKIVISTNIAETSITIDGIKTVIDSGIAKMNYYNQKDFTSSLITLPISRSSCEQRSGRAGRTSPGECYRIYSEKDYLMRPEFGLEEILRTDLSEVVLRMSELGIFEYEKFPFITKPKKSAITSAEETLQFIGAIDQHRRLTKVGEYMVRFPLSPRHSRVIVEAMLHFGDVIEEIIIAIAFISSKTPFFLPSGEEDAARSAHQSFQNEDGDFISYLTIYYQIQKIKGVKEKEAFCKAHYLDFPSMMEIFHVAEQIGQIVSSFEIPIAKGGSKKNYLICLASGLLQFVCKKDSRNMYHSVTAQKIYIHPGSSWFKQLPEYLLAGEIVMTSKMYARGVSPLKKEWLDEISPSLRIKLQQGSETGKSKKDSKKQKEVIQDAKTISIYGSQYPAISSKKGRKVIAAIPLKVAKELYYKIGNTKSKVNNTPSTIVFQDSFIHFGAPLIEIVHISQLIDESKGILPSVPKGGFTSYAPKELIDNIDWILSLTRVKKESKNLYFVQLDHKGNGYYRFETNRDAFDALDISLYALGQAIDEINPSQFPQEAQAVKKKFDELLVLFDQF
ncbi:MAG: ATP-dependent RNA helicase [Spirochaetia bacterium]|nr:ATP-dependent RNA helicase [Spirochaetia bacterium]